MSTVSGTVSTVSTRRDGERGTVSAVSTVSGTVSTVSPVSMMSGTVSTVSTRRDGEHGTVSTGEHFEWDGEHSERDGEQGERWTGRCARDGLSTVSGTVGT